MKPVSQENGGYRWYEDSFIYPDGKLSRWKLNLAHLGHIQIDHTDDRHLSRRFGQGNGWYLSGVPGYGNYHLNQKLKARSLVGAQREAVAVVRRFLEQTLQELPDG